MPLYICFLTFQLRLILFKTVNAFCKLAVVPILQGIELFLLSLLLITLGLLFYGKK